MEAAVCPRCGHPLAVLFFSVACEHCATADVIYVSIRWHGEARDLPRAPRNGLDGFAFKSLQDALDFHEDSRRRDEIEIMAALTNGNPQEYDFYDFATATMPRPITLIRARVWANWQAVREWYPPGVVTRDHVVAWPIERDLG